MQRISLFIELWRNMGTRYMLFRIWYAIATKSGYFKWKFPREHRPVALPTLAAWRAIQVPFFFESKAALAFPKVQDAQLKRTAEGILAGAYSYFSSLTYQIDDVHDWVTNPDSGFRYDANQHWSEVPDFSLERGDIKYVWERSRFSYLYTLIRYDYHFGMDMADTVFQHIESWIDHNPYNCGPNHKCSQEMSLRVLNWFFALQYFKHSSALTEARFAKIMQCIDGHLDHIYDNIHFSRIAVRNNHAITETMTLWLSGVLMSYLPKAEKRKNHGKAWFEQEIAYQIYKDGTFLQFSMNYHRVVVQLLTYALRIDKQIGNTLAPIVSERAEKSLRFLRTCQDDITGKLPNYGQNDGALFFPLNATDYRDYRGQLQALAAILGLDLGYDAGAWQEDAAWFGLDSQTLTRADFPIEGAASFDVGGYYTLREISSLTFIRCGPHSDRPSQADNLHLDIWVNGENVLCDAGTYKYNVEWETAQYFQSTSAHNTCTLGDESQMQKGPRFVWRKWSQALSAKWTEQDDSWIFEGDLSAFHQIDSQATHRRVVKKMKGQLVWDVEDVMSQTPKTDTLEMRQYWHLPKAKKKSVEIGAFRKEQVKGGYEYFGINPTISKGFISDYYGQKAENESFYFASDTKMITTKIEVK
jgi:Heparinase II/III-like protein/Heparinase II/III N-terminus